MKIKKILFALSAAAAILTASCSNEPVVAPVYEDYEAEAAAVVSMIDAIETVDFTTESQIEEAFAAYCFLDENARKLVSNYDQLNEYRNEVAKLYYTEELQGPRMDRSKVNIGTYCFNSQCWTDEGVKALADCGINLLSAVAYNNDLFDLLDKYGIGAFVSGVVPGWYSGGGEPANAGKMSEYNPLSAYDSGMASFVDRECIWAIDVGDEPVTVDLPHFGDVIDYIIPAFPNQLIYLNLLPSFGTYDYVNDYLETYVKEVNTDYISYDHYIFGYQGRSREKNVCAWLGDIQKAQEICNENDKDLWIVIQVSSNDTVGHLNEDELRVQSSLCLTYGAREISWACWNAGWFNYHVADANGDLTEIYDSLKAVNEEVHLISPVYSKYSNVVSGYIGQDPHRIAMFLGSEVNDCEEFVVSDIKNCSVSAVETGKESNVYAGYFEKRNGDGSALMFTNFTDYYCQSDSPAAITFTVKDSNAKVTAYLNGEIVPITSLGGGQYRFNLDNADNLFVTIE